MSDILILKANILGGMNEYIHEVGDEDILDDWYAYGVPDGCDEDMLMEIAEDDKSFTDISKEFTALLKVIHRRAN